MPRQLVFPCNLGGSTCVSGFKPDVPTVWLAEGLLNYLTQQQNETLLHTLHKVQPTLNCKQQHTSPPPFKCFISRCPSAGSCNWAKAEAQNQCLLFSAAETASLSATPACPQFLICVMLDAQVSAPGSTFVGTLASEAWEEQRVRLNEGGHFVNLKKFRKWGGPNKVAEVNILLHVVTLVQ